MTEHRWVYLSWVLVILFVAFSLLLQATPALAQAPHPERAPLSAAYKDWLERHPSRGNPGPLGGSQGGGRRSPGYLPHPLDLSHVRAPVFRQGLGDPPYPAAYDLRAQGWVTPVKDQGGYGTCWSFACLGAMESALLKTGRGPFTLSEWHLAYFAFQPLNRSLLSAYTLGAVIQGGRDQIFDQGGNELMVTAMLARGTGAVQAADCPYMPGPYRPEARPAGDLPNGREPVAVPLEAALFLYTGDPRSASNDVKYALTHHGPVVIAMDWEDGRFDSQGSTYRDLVATVATLNHMVCIVGWDDQFSPERFPAQHRPAAPGAWIVRNSWGSGWGDGGYFYLSYDSTLFDATVLLGGQLRAQRIYQYDPLGWMGGRGFGSDTAFCANVFQAKQRERITAVAFYSVAPATTYEISMIPKGASRATLGAAWTSGDSDRLQKGKLLAPGYHRVLLEQPVTVEQGDHFAVALKLVSPEYAFPVPVQERVPGYSDQAVALHGRSFMSANGVCWQDLSPSCQGVALCLKAFAEKAE